MFHALTRRLRPMRRTSPERLAVPYPEPVPGRGCCLFCLSTVGLVPMVDGLPGDGPDVCLSRADCVAAMRERPAR